ncbi:MAG: hypothetical protein JNL21_08215 [Myxococcales bacterium]|nr:hypothetical protein [Myxococcales bacterium]
MSTTIASVNLVRAALVVAWASVLVACEAGEDATGEGGAGGGATTTTTTTSTTSSSTGSGVGGDDSVCGDGVREGDEGCDGDDFGGATCESLGLGPGALGCAVGCGIITSACTAAERCYDQLDNDFDALLDCLDPACAATPACESGCSQAQTIVVSNEAFADYEFHGSTIGKPNGVTPSCATDSGPEAVITFVAPATMWFTVELMRFGADTDYSLSIRTSCGDPASEIACIDRPTIFPAFMTERIWLEATSGTTYHVIVDARAGSTPGLFALFVTPALPETVLAEDAACGDGVDNDGNGETDCNDPACSGSPDCVPGALPFGASCLQHNECASVSGKPVCLTALVLGQNVCSAWCDLAAPDCGAGNVCVPTGEGEGVCLDGCTTEAECAAGLGCEEVGASTRVCASLEGSCTDQIDDNSDGLSDCREPECAGTPACAPGTKAIGEVCSSHDECAAAGGVPVCNIDHCSEACDPTDPGACGADALCLGHTFLGYLCYAKCEVDDDCPDPSGGCFDLPPGYQFHSVCSLIF